MSKQLTGDYNTGDYNTGDYNTGYYNTGYHNTGNYNTGYYNTGDGNATSYCSGFFCIEEPKVICFDVQTEFTIREFIAAFPEHRQLCTDLRKKETIDFEKYKKLPGITPEKLLALHEKHLKGKCNG